MNNDIENILASVDRVWPKDHIIRYLYVKLAPCFRRDLRFFLASHEEKLSQFKAGFKKRGKDIVCSTLVDYYIEFFRMFDIKTEKIVATNNQIPLFAMIVEGERGLYYMDPLNDLFINQYELMTQYFCIIPHYKKLNSFKLTRLDDYTLRKIDRNLGLHKYDVYTSDIFSTIKTEFLTRSIFSKSCNLDIDDLYGITKRKLEIIRDNLINLGNVQGLYERMFMYGFIRGQLFDKGERKHTRVEFDNEDPFDIKLDFIIDYPEHEEEVYEEYKDEKGLFTLERIK